MQIPGIDYDKTFSPVACFKSLWLLLALAALEDWHIHQMDVNLAFLNGMLDKKIYMEQPQCFIVTGMENKVCKLEKSIYGLIQASCTWNLQFHGFLLELGFKQMSSDAGVYVMHQSWGEDSLSPLIVILYANDITIMVTSLEAVKPLKDDLQKHYEMSGLREIESYLGIHITCNRSHKCTEIDQSGYIKDVLDCFGMIDMNPHNTPILAGADVHLVKNTEQASPVEIKHYQSLIGSLLYVQIGTHPDISFAVSYLAQYAANPSKNHLHLTQYILSYLVGTIDMHLYYDGANGNGLHGYSDSSIGDNTEDCHSTSGYVFLIANGTISWSSHNQKTIT